MDYNKLICYNKKAYDYYPSGRVDIGNNRATIYLNANINTVNTIEEIKSKFGLSDSNISNIRTVVDGSSHYRCWMDSDMYEQKRQ